MEKKPNIEKKTDFYKSIIKTDAHQAKSDIYSQLFNSETKFFKEWQLSDYIPYNRAILSTLEEIPFLWKSQARLRPGFEVSDKEVIVPNLFIILNGIDESLKTYGERLSLLINKDETALILKSSELLSCLDLPIKVEYKKGNKLNDEFNLENTSFKILSYVTQKIIIRKINEASNDSYLLKDDYKKEYQDFFRHDILTTNDKIINYIRDFDFPFDIPKIIIIHSPEEHILRYQVQVLSFLFYLGFDVLIINPSNTSSYERYINKEYCNIFRLPNTMEKLNLKKYLIKEKILPQETKSFKQKLLIFLKKFLS